LLFTVYQDKIKSRISFYYENLLSKGLRKYFGESLTKQLIKDEGKINAETRWVTISFTDMNKYSTIIEKMSPDIAVQFLNEYFTTLHKVIKKYNGVILNYIGDSVMVIYGAPEPQKDHEILALKTALEMREELKALNQKWNDDKFSRYWKNIGIDEVTCRTGLHCGNLTIGNMGSDDLLQYSAIGDVVNIAARLETVNKEFSTEISMSEEIYASLTEEFTQKAKLQGEINLKGRTKKTNVYSI
jgi:adenylate cyclase